MEFKHPSVADKAEANNVFEDLCICWEIYKSEGYEIISTIESYRNTREGFEQTEKFQNLLRAAIAFGIFSQRIKSEEKMKHIYLETYEK